MSLRYLIQISFVAASLVLYILAPKEYSFLLCNICLFIFIFSSINLLMQNLKGNFVIFEFFFILAFYFTNYVYPTFYYPINPYFSLFQLSFNESYITKGTALATLGITSFNLGIFQYNIRKKSAGYKGPQNINKFQNTHLIILFAVVLFLIFIVNMAEILSKGTYNEMADWGSLNRFIFETFIYILYYLIFVQFIKCVNKPRAALVTHFNKLVFVMVGISVIMFLYIGYRTIPMRILLLLICLYTLVYGNLKIKIFLPIFALGVLLMFSVGEIRNVSDKQAALPNVISGIDHVLEVGNELTINNRSLYVLMDYTDKYGVSYGKNFLMNIFSLVPLLQSFVLNNLGVNLRDISSPNLVTDLYYIGGEPDRKGLGTNLIGDIYLAFGSLGVPLLMYLFGLFIKRIHMKALRKNAKYILLYSLIFMDAVYYTRSTYLTPLRTIAWVFAIYWLGNLKLLISVKQVKRKFKSPEEKCLQES